MITVPYLCSIDGAYMIWPIFAQENDFIKAYLERLENSKKVFNSCGGNYARGQI